MALTGADIWHYFQDETGTAVNEADGVVTQTQALRWWNEGQSRLNRYDEIQAVISWAAGDLEAALPAGFIQIVKLDMPVGTPPQDWRVFNNKLVLDDPNGATAACTNARLHYWGERFIVGSSNQDTDVSVGSYAEDIACIYYALHRFYRRLASDRVHFTRYATLLGANAISVGDLQAESDRLLQDFRDARDDLPPLQPAAFFISTRPVMGR